jgi:hypothetical protein
MHASCFAQDAKHVLRDFFSLGEICVFRKEIWRGVWGTRLQNAIRRETFLDTPIAATKRVNRV